VQHGIDPDTVNRRQQPLWWKFPVRLVVIVFLAFCFGSFLSRFSASLERRAHPAGFGTGLIQGALMPMALPNLVVGKDISIYAGNNTGVGYKLGYTAGVNMCGALFFGVVFWRFNRWRTKANACKPSSR